MDETITLDGADVARLNEVFDAVRSIDNMQNIRVNKIEFTIYEEHKVTITSRGKWCPLMLRKIRKVLR